MRCEIMVGMCSEWSLSRSAGDCEIDIFPRERRLRRSFPPAEPVCRSRSTTINVVSESNHTLYRTKHCWQNYVDYYKCVNAKGDDFRPCRQVHSTSTTAI